MKIAILGGGLLALESLIFFDDLGAEVILFSKSKLGGFYKQFQDNETIGHFNNTYTELTSKLGRKLIEFDESYLDTIPSFYEFNQNYLSKLIDLVLTREDVHYKIIESEVLRVHKCFLSPDDDNEGTSRLEDLFRVVYNMSPPRDSDFSSMSLPDGAIEGLKEDYEAYKDFDLVIDARGAYAKPIPMGPSNSPAINEKKFNIKNEKIYYAHETYKNINKVNNPIIVGSNDHAAFLLTSIDHKLFETNLSIKIVTNEKNAFESFFSNTIYSELSQKLSALLERNDTDFLDKKRNYEKLLFEYRERPDYERVKYEEPKLPQAKIEITKSKVVLSVDKLFENDDIFLSLESSKLKKDKSNKNKESKTIFGDSVFVCKGFLTDDITMQNIEEPGYFTFKTSTCMHPIISGHNEIKDFELKIMNYFSRAR